MSTRRLRSFGLVFMGALGGVLLSLGISAVAQKPEPLPLKELQQFANVFAAIKASYVEPLGDKKLIDDAIKGMFSDLDPHSAYLDADAFKEMEAITQGGFGGLGIEIGSEDGMPKVIAPIEDTPAARAGILSGDFITHIDGKATKGMSLAEAIKLMRGEPKTSIVLTIQRAGRDKPLTIEIVRDLIKVRSVRSKMLPDDIAYVRIAQFQERTVSDLLKHLNDLYSEHQPKALVLDLRNDPGGLLEGAIGVSSIFLPADQLVVSTKGRVASANREYYSRAVTNDNGFFNRLLPVSNSLAKWSQEVPMVVLVNVGSASASEIVAGALQDHERAKIIGNQTFGKGSVQSVLPLSNETGIKLTTARYYTPKGRSIQVTGVMPDIIVDDTELGNLFRVPREGDLEHHLLNGDEVATRCQQEELDDLVADIPMFEFGGEDDFQLQQAVNYLEGRPVKRNNEAKIAALKQKAGTETKEQQNSDTAEKKNDAAATQPERIVVPEKIERYRVGPEGLIRLDNE
ncbi:MAG TPA: S41 family peptidase [Burkholderiaceae bacterium]|nr:S41 family peptidase [Burkholderiaceae bacterium]